MSRSRPLLGALVVVLPAVASSEAARRSKHTAEGAASRPLLVRPCPSASHPGGEVEFSNPTRSPARRPLGHRRPGARRAATRRSRSARPKRPRGPTGTATCTFAARGHLHLLLHRPRRGDERQDHRRRAGAPATTDHDHDQHRPRARRPPTPRPARLHAGRRRCAGDRGDAGRSQRRHRAGAARPALRCAARSSLGGRRRRRVVGRPARAHGVAGAPARSGARVPIGRLRARPVPAGSCDSRSR